VKKVESKKETSVRKTNFALSKEKQWNVEKDKTIKTCP
jgi:hypothetical protein